MTSAPDASAHASWLAQFFAAVDRMDETVFARHFDPDSGSFRFANHPPVHGREAIAAGCAGIFGLLDSIRHDIQAHWVADNDLLVEGQVHYRRKDGFELSVPFMSVFEFAAGSPGPVRAYRVFVDSHALFEGQPAA